MPEIYKIKYKTEEGFEGDLEGFFIETPVGYIKVVVLSEEFVKIPSDKITLKSPIIIDILGRIKYGKD